MLARFLCPLSFKLVALIKKSNIVNIFKWTLKQKYEMQKDLVCVVNKHVNEKITKLIINKIAINLRSNTAVWAEQLTMQQSCNLQRSIIKLVHYLNLWYITNILNVSTETCISITETSKFKWKSAVKLIEVAKKKKCFFMI